MSIHTDASGSWRMVATLPGLDLRARVEGRGMAMLGAADPLYAVIKRQDAGVAEYLGRFSTPFAESISPSMLIVPSEALNRGAVPEKRVADFRNLVAISFLSMSRTIQYRSPWRRALRYSEAFDIYPIALTRSGDSVTPLLPDEMGMISLSRFRGGQPSPVVARPGDYEMQVDSDLRDALLALWNEDPKRGSKRLLRVKVFRSLAVAFHALRAPAAVLKRNLDAWVALSLWVAAFETLASPPPGEDVRSEHVRVLVSAVPWHNKRLRQRRFRPIEYRSQKKIDKEGLLPSVSLPIQICQRLYLLRNRFLHGNTLPENLIEPARRGRWGYLDSQVPCVYRCVLLHLLSNHGFGHFPPRAWEAKDFDRIREHRAFEDVIANEKPSSPGKIPSLKLRGLP